MITWEKDQSNLMKNYPIYAESDIWMFSKRIRVISVTSEHSELVLKGLVLRTAQDRWTGPDQDRGPGPSILSEQGPEKTAVLGPVQTGTEPNRDGRRVGLKFI